MKKYVRIFLILNCIGFIAVLIDEISLVRSQEIFFEELYSFSFHDLLWIVLGVVIPLISLVIATVYSFLLTWKSRYLLVVAIGLYATFLLFPECGSIYGNYVSIFPAITILTVGGYIACILFPKLPGRYWIAFLLLCILIAWMLITYWFDDEWVSLLAWGPRYAAPLASFAMLGYILPNEYD